MGCLSTKPTLKTTFQSQDEIIDKLFSFDLIHYLSLHFGYIPPSPLPKASRVDSDKWKIALKNTGLRTEETNLPPPEYGKSILRFLDGLLSSSRSQCLVGLWDFYPSNPGSICQRKILDAVPNKGEKLFVVDPRCFAMEPQFKWTIAVSEAGDAVKVY